VTDSDLARQVRDVSRLTGEFVLRSGRTATEYFDKYQFEADPVLLDRLAEQMAALIPEGTEVLAGLEMGGIAVVTALGRHAELPCAFVRKEA
jgi:orotate phosphoribosyltransferase